jgi:RHS repeat-associated protein
MMSCSLIGIAQDDSKPDRGFHPANSYALGDIETINTSSGNLMLNVPLGALPAGRGGHPGFKLNLSYNSKIYDTHAEIVPDQQGQDVERNQLGESQQGGWRYQLFYDIELHNRLDHWPNPSNRPQPPDLKTTYIYKLKLHMPDGSSREMRPTGYTDQLHDGYFNVTPQPGMTYFSTDGSFLRLDIGQNGERTLSFPDGSRVVFGNGLQRNYDRNGNYVEIQNTSYNNHPAYKIEDQLGRSIIIEYDQQLNQTTGIITRQDHIYVNGFGAQLQWTIHWKQIYVYKKYFTTRTTQYPQFVTLTPLVVDQITLPSQAGNLSYAFGYNAGDYTGDTEVLSDGWGEVNSVTLPSGAQASYTYALDGISAPYQTTFPHFQHVLNNKPTHKTLTYQAEYDSNSSPVTENWSYGTGAVISTVNANIPTVTGPDGGVTQEYLYSDVNSPFNGRAYKTVYPDGTVVERLWMENRPYFPTNAGPASNIGVNPYVKTEFTSIPNALGNLTKTAIKDYNCDKNGYITKVKEYDWVAYGTVHDGSGTPQWNITSLTPQRVMANSYYTVTPDASDSTTDDPDTYHKATSPLLRNAAASTEVSNGTQVLARSEFFYDNATTTGNLTQQKSWDSTKGAYSNPLITTNSIAVSHQYDVYGNLTLSTDARNYQTKFIYSSIGSVTDLYPTEIKTAFGQSEQRTTDQAYDFNTGLVTSTTDADNGVTNETDYDAFGRPVEIRAAANVSAVKTVTRMEYSDVARRVITRSDLNVAYDGKLVSIKHYDQLGRVRLTRQLEDAATQSVTNETTGIKTQVRYLVDVTNHFTYQLTSNPYRAATSSTAGGEGTMGWTRSKADISGRVIEVESFSGSGLPAPWDNNTSSTGKVITSYDANYTTVTDQAGKVRRSKVNALGQLVRVDEPNTSNSLGDVETPTQYTSYVYDALGNLKTVTQGAQSRTFDYSSLSRLSSATNPENGTISYEYDDNGNLKKKLDSRLVESGDHLTVTYIYDALNRLTSRSYNDGTLAKSYSDRTPIVTYTYDTLTNGKGRLTSVSSAGVSTTNYLGYDALGRVTGSSQVTDGVTYSMPDYKYDLAGNLTSQTYPSGRVITTTFDNAGRLSQVDGQKTGESNKTYISSPTYSAHGAMTEVKVGLHLWEHTIFNARLQPALIGLGTVQNVQNAQDFSRFRVDYAYNTPNQADNNGNVLQQTISVPDSSGTYVAQMSQYYEYDELNRLKTAVELNGSTQSWKQGFLYDRYGNRTFNTATGETTSNVVGSLLTIDSANNRITANQGYILYDNAGNLTRDFTGHTFGYDAENKQVSYDGGSASNGTDYKYDGDGRRVKKVNGTSQATTVFVYNVMGQMVAEYANTPPDPNSGGTSYLTSDSLGTPRIITAADGSVKARHDYLPFGEEIAYNLGGRSSVQKYDYGATSLDNVKQKFTQYERDNETGLDFAQARYYVSSQGRFTSPDPLISSGLPPEPQSWNRYTYTINKPLKYTDPSGLIWGYYTDQQGQGRYHWFDDQKQLEASGATVVTDFVYKAYNGSWIRLNSEANQWGAYESQGQAIENTNGPLGDSSTVTDQAFSFALSETGGRILGNLGSRLFSNTLGRIFSSGASETASEGAGLLTEGLAYERRFLFKHLPGTKEAAREIAEGEAHVFNDLATLSHVENEILNRGVYTGTTGTANSTFARFGLRFEQPIGTRIAKDGTRITLDYGEMKIRANGLYHIVPRTGPR